MTDTPQRSPLTKDTSLLWQARSLEGLSREKVTRLLDPPISTKTLERWEKGLYPVPRATLRQLAIMYRVRLEDLIAATNGNGRAA